MKTLFAIIVLSLTISFFAQSADDYRKAANQGNAKAQYSLGMCYIWGHGVKKDFVKAVYWLQKSAMQGNAEAQYNLGVCYENGDGVKKNLTEAIKWYTLAARQGDKDAQEELKKLGKTW